MVVLQACHVCCPNSGTLDLDEGSTSLAHLWSACGLPWKAPPTEPGEASIIPAESRQFDQVCPPFLPNNVQFVEQSHTFTGWVDFDGFPGTSKPMSRYPTAQPPCFIPHAWTASMTWDACNGPGCTAQPSEDSECPNFTQFKFLKSCYIFEMIPLSTILRLFS